jgi:hypothetical protein
VKRERETHTHTHTQIKFISNLFHFFFLWRCDPTRVMASSLMRFSISHTTMHHSP